VAGIAETGSLLVASGPGTPQLRHFLPDIHIAALAAERIVGGYEDGWALLRAESARVRNGIMPRAATLITGPSRTSDIERTVQIGVHGPRRLHIVLFTSP
jgi:L-lactate dehydrogenase complex protein LldG